MIIPRSSGILLHPTSLPSGDGIGDFGPGAYRFLDFLAQSRQTLWQVLPLGPVGYGNSPYSSTSAFAGNIQLISLERLAEKGWLERKHLPPPLAVGPVDYEAVRKRKRLLLRDAAARFLRTAPPPVRARYLHFCHANGWWLEEYVFFDALRERFGRKPWNEWPHDLKMRLPSAISRVARELTAELETGRALQFAFFEQWGALRRAAHERGIRIVGDVAIFVSYDSADVWTQPDHFHLDAEGAPTVVAGVPPDAFSQTGQRWGNPLYRWDVLRAHGYNWWVRRILWTRQQCDILRLDHFRGFEKYWAIPAREPTAIHGRWVDGPGDGLFAAMRNALDGELPFIAEDLGYITPEVHALRNRWGFPGMRVMQFGFGDPGASDYLPHRYPPDSVAYTGTHDNDTTLGWWKNGSTEAERTAATKYLEPLHEPEVCWAFIKAIELSQSAMCIVPLQDVLGLGSEARMNIPSHPEGNWEWRFEKNALTPALAARMAEVTRAAGREHNDFQKAAPPDNSCA